jgi:hypothetical protein
MLGAIVVRFVWHVRAPLVGFLAQGPTSNKPSKHWKSERLISSLLVALTSFLTLGGGPVLQNTLLENKQDYPRYFVLIVDLHNSARDSKPYHLSKLPILRRYSEYERCNCNDA